MWVGHMQWGHAHHWNKWKEKHLNLRILTASLHPHHNSTPHLTYHEAIHDPERALSPKMTVASSLAVEYDRNLPTLLTGMRRM